LHKERLVAATVLLFSVHLCDGAAGLFLGLHFYHDISVGAASDLGLFVLSLLV
jgi:hypothetical protein